MSVPGSNILRQALTAIRCSVLQYFAASGRSLNSVGQWVTTYAPSVEVYGSFQPVPKNLYEQWGLDLQKTYFVFYSLNPIIDIQRNVSNDRLSYQGEFYQCESNTDWFRADSWEGVLCCKLNNSYQTGKTFGFNSAPGNNTNTNFGNGNFNAG